MVWVFSGKAIFFDVWMNLYVGFGPFRGGRDLRTSGPGRAFFLIPKANGCTASTCLLVKARLDCLGHDMKGLYNGLM